MTIVVAPRAGRGRPCVFRPQVPREHRSAKVPAQTTPWHLTVAHLDNVRQRPSRGGNRHINQVLHIMATVQLRTRTTEGRAYYDRKVAAGKTPNEAMRCLKRRLSDVVYRTMIGDVVTAERTGP
jgi:hypothetical protein